MYSIQERFRSVILKNTSDKRRWSELEALTGIAATSWQKAFNLKQRPTSEMLEAVARLWPCFAFWLVTGVTDAKNGHVACGYYSAGTQFYPERPHVPRNAARPYFDHLLDMFRRCYGDGPSWGDEVLEKDAFVSLLRLEVARDAESQALSETEPNSGDVLRQARDSYQQALEGGLTAALGNPASPK